MIKFYCDEEIGINEKIRDICPSEITVYFLKCLTTDDILKQLFQTDYKNSRNETEILNEVKIPTKTKRLNEREKIDAMTDNDRIYLRKKLLNSELNLLRKRKENK